MSEREPMSESGQAPSKSMLGVEISRRRLLHGLAGLGAATAALPLLSACGSSSSSSSGGSSSTTAAPAGGSATTAAGGGGTKTGGSISFGSNYSDPSVKSAFAALVSAASAATGVKISVNTVDHNTFQNDITSYLQGTPNDLFTWFAGYRMQYFAAQGLASQIDDVWDKIGANFSDSTKALSKGEDGHYYFVPLYNYPWVVFYNKSTFSQKGYQVPTTWDQFIALCKQMKSDGLIPLAFAEKDGWPALGTFDIINLRLNGYDYHMKLMKHQVPWTDPGVTAVFNQWAELLPYCQTGANGRIWEDAAKTLESKQAGMMFQGTNQVAANYSAADLADLDFFVYPEINPQWGQDYMDAPADGFMMSKSPKDRAAAAAVLEYIGTGPAETTYLQSDKWDVGLATNASQANYDYIQKKSVQVISQCKAVSQFMDRDTDPGLADNIVSAAVQQFINDPSPSTIKTIQSNVEAQAKTIFNT
jgi:multiple sugar transport system substrate-binding protein